MKKASSGKRVIRSCVSCGSKLEQSLLDRFTWQDGKPEADQEVRRPGRGVYCCMNDECRSRLMTNRKKWARFFRL